MNEEKQGWRIGTRSLSDEAKTVLWVYGKHLGWKDEDENYIKPVCSDDIPRPNEWPAVNIKHKKLKIKPEERIMLERGAKEVLCPNCGKKGPHFVPPSLGEQGFFLCDKEE